MAAASVLLLVVATISPSLTASIPSYIKTCKRDSPDLSKCFAKSVQDVIPNIVTGDKKLKIPVIDPFLIDEILFTDMGNNKASHIDMKFNKMKVIGLKALKVGQDTKIDLKNKKLAVRITVPSLQIDGMYTINGKILNLPIKGNGDIKAKMDNLDIAFYADITFNKGKDGKDYIQLVNPKLNANPQHFTIHLGNLFNGDAALGDTMNNFLNENWEESFKEFGPAVKDTCIQIINPLLNSIASSIPYDELFPK